MWFEEESQNQEHEIGDAMIEIYDLEEFNVVIDDKVGAVKKKLVNYDGSFMWYPRIPYWKRL